MGGSQGGAWKNFEDLGQYLDWAYEIPRFVVDLHAAPECALIELELSVAPTNNLHGFEALRAVL